MAVHESPAARASVMAFSSARSASSRLASAWPISRRCRASLAGVVAGSRVSSHPSTSDLCCVLAIVITPSQVIVEFRAHPVSVNHPLRLVSGHDDHLQQAPCPIGTQNQQPQLALVLLLDVAERVSYGMQHVIVIDAVLSSAVRDLHRRHHNIDNSASVSTFC